MAAEKAPAFQFYPRDFLIDGKVAAMTLAERGAYITLLCLCWTEGSLPSGMSALARLCKVSQAAFTRLWPALEPCFRGAGGDGSRIVQPRIERERQKQETYRTLKATAGREGGKAKAASQQRPSRRLAKASPPSSSSSSSSVFDLPSSKEHTSADADYEAFRAAYPASRRVGGKAGRRAFEQSAIGRHGDPLGIVLLALAAQKRSEQWQTPRLIPLMTTWLNQERWLQEFPPAALVRDHVAEDQADAEAVLKLVQADDARVAARGIR